MSKKLSEKMQVLELYSKPASYKFSDEADDLLYNVETPEAFVNECRKRGYYRNYQSKINFEFD